MRIAVITNYPAPYRQPLFDAVCRHEPGVVVIYEGRGSTARRWGSATSAEHEHLFASEHDFEAIKARARWRNATRALARIRPDLVVAGGFGPAALAAAAHAWRRRVPLVGWSGATRLADARIGTVALRSRRSLAKRAEAWIAYGPEAGRYLEDLDASPGSIIATGNPYGLSPSPPRRPDAGTIRVGFAGQLHWRKAWWVPVQAVDAAREQGVDAQLEIVGDGPGRRLLAGVLEGSGAGKFHWDRHLAPAEMAGFYDRIDLLITPSLLDQWPIVASEASARGVPVAASPERRSGVPPQASTLTGADGPEPGAILAYAELIRSLAQGGAEGVTQRVRSAQQSLSPDAVAGRWQLALAIATGERSPDLE